MSGSIFLSDFGRAVLCASFQLTQDSLVMPIQFLSESFHGLYNAIVFGLYDFYLMYSHLFFVRLYMRGFVRLNCLVCESDSDSFSLCNLWELLAGWESLVIYNSVLFECKIVFIFENVLVALTKTGSFSFGKVPGVFRKTGSSPFEKVPRLKKDHNK